MSTMFRAPSPTKRTGRTAFATLLLAAGASLGLAAPHAAAASDVVLNAVDGKVIAKTSLAEHTGPSTALDLSGKGYASGTVISIDCKLNGTTVDGNPRWYKIKGEKSWVSARYVENIGEAPKSCIAGDWAYEVTEGTTVREGPSTDDAELDSVKKGEEIKTRYHVKDGESVDGNTQWVAVDTSDGNRGWVPVAKLKLIN